MDFVLGMLGIIQITFLPGLIVYTFFRLRIDLFEKVLIIFGTSLVANYCVIFLLSALGIYTRITFSLFILGEWIAIVWLYRNDFNTPSLNLLDTAQHGINEIISFFFPKNISTLHYFLGIVLLLLSAKSIAWAVTLFVRNLGTVFSVWDAVVAWNPWATGWAAGQIPMDSHFYPQLIPANWSITYVLLGSTTIQFFAKAIMPLFTLMMLLGFLNLAIQIKKYSFLISLALLEPLLQKFINTGLTSGYVDIAVGFFAFATIYVLIKAQTTSEIDQRNQLYILGTIFSAGAAVTKQTGVYIAVLYPILVFIQMILSKSPWERKVLAKLLSVFIAISIIWVSWYVLKEIQILTGQDSAGIDTYISITANSYDHANLFQQIATAIGQHWEFLVLFPLLLLTFPWMERFYKALTIAFAPYPFIWAWIAAYDTRNLAIFLPVLALLAGYSIDLLLSKLIEASEKGKIVRTPLYLPIVLVLLGLVGLSFILTPQRLEQRQVELQKQIFSPSKNQMLYNLVSQNGPQTRILTNYPMNYLPGLEQYQVRFNFQDYDLFLNYLKDPKIEYMLIPNAIDGRIKDYIDAQVSAGNFELISKDKQWKVYTLLRILRKE